MNDLTPEDRALLDLARDGHDPSDADRGRVRMALGAQLAIGSGLAAATTAEATSAAATGATGATGAAGAAGAGALGTVAAASGMAIGLPAMKLTVAVVIAATIGGGGFAIYRAAHPRESGVAISVTSTGEPRDPPLPIDQQAAEPIPARTGPLAAGDNSPSPPPRPMATLAPPRDQPLAFVPRSLPAPALSPPIGEGDTGRMAPSGPGIAALAPPSAVAGTATTALPEAIGSSLPALPATPLGEQTSTPGAAPMASSQTGSERRSTGAPTTIEAETRLVRAGVAALHAGDAARALAAFDQHARDYPNGLLAEERSAERVIALCDLGRRADARVGAVGFLRQYPHSPLAARVRSACASTGGTNP